jgi:DNA-binding CsgD family transcriptional regulator
MSHAGGQASGQKCGALSEREREVVVLVVEGLSNADIAVRLGISRRTVQAHVSNALRKTTTRSRVQLAVLALRSGLVSIADASARCGCGGDAGV